MMKPSSSASSRARAKLWLRVLERVVAHEADALERSAAVGLERGRPPRQFVQMRGHLIDLVEVGLQNTFQRRRIRSPRQLAKALVEPPCPTGGEEKRDHRQKQRGDKGCDDGADVGRDDGVQVDRPILQGAHVAVRRV